MGALSEADKRKLHNCYFTPREIKDFDTAKAIDGSTQELNTKAENFKMMMRNRVRRVASLKRKGWSNQRIFNLIESYYSEKHRSKRSAFDFLQIEQSPSSRMRPETDNSIARRLLKLARVQSVLGANYTKAFPQQSQQQPRNIPARPEY